jgi:hypothetical protein
LDIVLLCHRPLDIPPSGFYWLRYTEGQGDLKAANQVRKLIGDK